MPSMTQTPLAKHHDFISCDPAMPKCENLQLLLSCNDFGKSVHTAPVQEIMIQNQNSDRSLHRYILLQNLVSIMNVRSVVCIHRSSLESIWRNLIRCKILNRLWINLEQLLAQDLDAFVVNEVIREVQAVQVGLIQSNGLPLESVDRVAQLSNPMILYSSEV